MALNRTSPQAESTNSTVEYTNLAEGEHEGRLVYVADLGLQERSYMGEEKPPAQQISLGIEVMGNAVNVDGTMRPRLLWTKPFNIFQKMDERGNEYKYFKTFQPTAQDGQVADWDSVLGTPCNVIVKHQVTGDRTYDNIDSITPIPAKYQDAVAASEFTDACVGDCNDENNAAQKAMFGLARFVFEKRISPKSKPDLKVVSAAESGADVEFSDDIPF
jgi:hypothetical protein